MKKSRFSNKQIDFALKQAETGTPVEEVCRKFGVSQPTFYRWKNKFGGLGVEELRRSKFFETRVQATQGPRCSLFAGPSPKLRGIARLAL